MSQLVWFLHFIVAILIVLSVHESSHALMAYYLGDPTAKNQGRISLNPVRHLDLMGSMVFLITQRIGWGKPVPVNPNNFQNPVKDNALTALAGPISNFILAFLIALPLKFLGPSLPLIVNYQLSLIFDVSVVLGVFNLIPLPPLDGSKVIGFFVPRKYYPQYMRYLNEGSKYLMIWILFEMFFSDRIGFSLLYLIIERGYEFVSFILKMGV